MARYKKSDMSAVPGARHAVYSDPQSARRFWRGALCLSASTLSLLVALGSGAQAQDQQDGEPSRGAGWQYSANTNAAFTLTDNVLLTQFNPESDFITSLTAGVQVFNETRGGSIDFDYQLNYDFYADTDQLNGFRHNLLTQNTFNLVDDLFFLDINASVREQAATRNLRTPATTRTINGDQTMVLAGSIAPYIDTTIAGRIGVVARVDYSTVSFRRPDVSGSSGSGDDDTIWSGNFMVNELDQDKRLHWEFSGQASADDDDLEQQGTNLALRLRMTQNSRLLARGGHDKTDGRTNGRDIDDVFWRLGMELEPIRDSYIRFEAGERFGGPSYDAEVRYDVARALRITASYVQALRTDQNRFVDMLNSLEPVFLGSSSFNLILEDPNAPYFDLVFEGDITEELTITDTAKLTLSGGLGRIRYSLTGSYQTREFEELPGLGGPFEEEATNVSLGIVRDFGRRTQAGINMQYVDEESDLPVLGGGPLAINLARVIDSISGSVFASYSLSPTAALQANYTWSRREDQDEVEVEENVFMLTITKVW